jgi:hypothetical protein
MADLIDITRAKQSASLAALAAGSNSAYLPSLIAAASDAVRQYCHRDFNLATYSEYRNGGIYIQEPLNLRNFPVTDISEIATANRALQVLNSGGAAQKATVQTLSNGDVKLVSVASAVTTTTTLAAATYPTIGAMATAINAVSGWSTTIYSGSAGSYSAFPTTDLKTMQGAASAMIGGAYLDIYEAWYGWNNAAWFPEDGYDVGAATAFWRLDSESGQVFGHLPRGQLNLRITYTAGYAQGQVPAAVQEATVQIAQWMYQSSLTNSSYVSERLGNAAVEYANRKTLPESAMALLAQYVSHDKMIAR